MGNKTRRTKKVEKGDTVRYRGMIGEKNTGMTEAGLFSGNHHSYPKANFNDLLAEWLNILDSIDPYQRGKNGGFHWIDICTWNDSDFNKFVHSRLSPTTARKEN